MKKAHSVPYGPFKSLQQEESDTQRPALCLYYPRPTEQCGQTPLQPFFQSLKSSKPLSGCIGNLRVDALTVIRFSQPW